MGTIVPSSNFSMGDPSRVSTTKSYQQEIPLEPALIALSKLNTPERIDYMQTSSGNARQIRVLADREKKECKNFIEILAGKLNPEIYKAELDKLNDIVNQPTFNRVALSFQDRQEFLENEIYHIFSDKILLPNKKLNPKFPDAQNIKELMLIFVKKVPVIFEHLNVTLRDDPDIAKEAVSRSVWNVPHASERLRDDPKIIEAAVNNHYNAFEYASERLRDDPDFVKALVTKNGMCIRAASARIKNNVEIVKIALQQNEMVSGYLPQEILKHPEIQAMLPRRRSFYY